MQYPLVTVFTFIYNTNPNYIIEAIQSVKANNYPNIQHIVIDDCSPDPVPKETVKKWIAENNYECEFYENEVNLGICKNLNYMLTLAKGKYLLGASDDNLVADRIITDVNVFEKLDENYALVFGLTQEMNSKSELQPNVFPNLIVQENDSYFNLLLNGNCLAAPSVTYKTEILNKVGGFNEDLSFEDYEMALRLANLGYQFKNIPKIQSYYRVHGESISNYLNYDLENLKILSLFSQEKNVQEMMYSKIWRIAFDKNENFREAKSIYEDSFGKNWKLTIGAMIKSPLILKGVTALFRLNILKK